MATLTKENDGAVIASWAIGNSDPVRLGDLAGGRFYVQFSVNAELLQGSNDGTNWGTVATSTGANSIIRVDAVPLFVRGRNAAGNGVPTGTVVAVGWRD